MMGAALKTLVAVVGALWLGIAGWAGAEWWERRPAGSPHVAFKVLFIPVHWSPPDSLAAQRDAARADLVICHGNIIRIDTALKRQNAAQRAISADGQRRLAAAEKALLLQQSATATARKRAGELLSTPPVGIDQCARWESADEAVRRALGEAR